MKKNISFCVALLLFIYALVSCGGDPHVHEYDSVTQKCTCGDINPLAVARVGADTRFLSLQEAVDFIKTRKSVSSLNTVYLLKNASGEGVTADGIVGGIAFDFGNFTYELTGSKGFEFINTETELKGGRITISVSASVETLISTSGSDLKTTSSFTGSIKLGTGSKLTVAGGEVSITGASITEENAFVIETGANVSVPDVSVAAEINAHTDIENSEESISITVPHTHTEDAGKVIEEPSCTSEGLKVFTCTECKQIIRTETIDKKAHVTSHTDYKAATHTEDGNVEYWYCSVCKKYFSDSACKNEITGSVVIPKIPHDMTHYIYRAATCTSGGNNDCYYCSQCKQYYENDNGTAIFTGTFAIPATGHNPEHIDYKAATCTERGIMDCEYCSNCKKYYTDSTMTVEIEEPVLYALGHDWKVDADGKHYCARPGCSEATPHTAIWTGDKKECDCDCSQFANNKHYTYHCTVCNHDYAAPLETSSIATGGGFSIIFPEQKVICADAHFGDDGTRGYVWVEENSGSEPVEITAVMIDISHSAQLEDGKYIIEYNGTIADQRDYIVDIYVTTEGAPQPVYFRKLFTRTVQPPVV